MEERCHKNSDCYMCWNSCRLFQGNSPAKSTLCSDHTACFPGCQTACNFYHVSSPKNLTPPSTDGLSTLPAFMAPPKLSEGGQLLWSPPSWPKEKAGPSQNEVILYIVMVNVEGCWNQHIQTTLPRAIIPDAIRGAAIRVLAVTSSGLIASAERAPRHAGDDMGKNDFHSTEKEVRVVLDTTTLSIRKALQGLGNGEGSTRPPVLENEKYSYDHEHNENRQPPSVTVDHSWEVKLKLLSVDLLASVEVTWDLRGSEQVDYLVTWTESTGSISGHLVTRQAKAEVSLWPRQHYSVQVELLDKQGNTVLKSMPKAINFFPDGFLEASRQGLEPDNTSEVTPKRISTPSDADRSSPQHGLVEPALKVTETLSSAVYKKGLPLWPGRNEEGSNPFIFPAETTASSHPDTPPSWRVEPPRNREPPSSGKVETFNTPSGEKSPSPLLAWTACLGVGAVVIMVLIMLAVRSLRRSASKRRKTRSDFLSETTASSVNSSSATTCSQLSRGAQQEAGKEEEPWEYEASYGVSHHIPGTAGIQQRSPLPPHVLSSPSEPPLCPLRRSPFLLTYGHPSHLIAPTLPPMRVENTSFIENCVVTLDPCPLDQRTNY